ncbi:hypothetical protein GKQ38_02855 [Candidatus Nanohaloarchaea archaeon]|nr:hypothetical protein GKQ38_02855 [Candidatus Nanohaloarchaea archaeon]
MDNWSPTYQDLEDVRPFMEVADERGYSPGENAEEMEVAEYNGSNVFVRPQDEESASYDLMAEVLADELDYDIRVPDASFDSEEGVLITSELGGEGELEASEHAAESLVDTYAFEALMGQGDILDNTSTDSEGFYAFDFENAGGSINGVYSAVKSEAESAAEEHDLVQYIGDFDAVGERAVEMAENLDLESLAESARSRGVSWDVYNDIESNIETARSLDETAGGPVFEPQSSEDDEGVELL